MSCIQLREIKHRCECVSNVNFLKRSSCRFDSLSIMKWAPSTRRPCSLKTLGAVFGHVPKLKQLGKSLLPPPQYLQNLAFCNSWVLFLMIVFRWIVSPLLGQQKTLLEDCSSCHFNRLCRSSSLVFQKLLKFTCKVKE